jgi:hypothetical protein
LVLAEESKMGEQLADPHVWGQFAKLSQDG